VILSNNHKNSYAYVSTLILQITKILDNSYHMFGSVNKIIYSNNLILVF